MSEQNPSGSFVPPPPPQPTGNPLYSPETLGAKAQYVAAEARNALILSIVGLFCAGFIFGFLAFRKANDALETISIYDVAHDKRSIALTAKVLGIIDIVGWIIAIIARFAL